MNWDKGKGIDPQNSSGSDSEKDEPFLTEDGYAEQCTEVNDEMGIPWQRMKWTDDVIRLLISVVASIDDDGLIDGGAEEGLKSKHGCLHKKGKWKMVSKIMIGKGCRVSPQQCEDKFNDLNKRYKKLNDILGRNISCSVVENPSLMDSMSHLSAKAKDEVRKILNSKHLFYKEMCAYHNGQNLPDCHYLDHQGSALMPVDGCSREINKVDDDGDDDDDEKYSSDESDDDDDSDSEDEDGDNGIQASEQHVGLDSFRAQMSRIFKDPTKSSRERKDWIKKKKLVIHKQRAIIQTRAFQIDKQCFKWLRYCSKKNEELEGLRMENEVMRIENEQSLLRLKQKELELGLGRSETYFDCSYHGTGNHQ
ncbi:PREDICTED: uncharacterized protein LOC104811130 [Tarenaya hassleriana]|uniref:uncharacterized protein LOC104811130 n=1 Tax=Tarenaya hassleriana TaxID=28532 RepID=UPI00053C3C34|nr:PREDICTED: uncharacterized protein LOC104811130 [Tarenaya hassleriana]